MKFFIVFFALVQLAVAADLDCYKCLNIEGKTPSRSVEGYGYGSGCKAGSLSKDFIYGCPDIATHCIKFEGKVGNVTVVVRDCGTAPEKSCKTFKENATSPYYTQIQAYEVMFFGNISLPLLPPNGTEITACSCDKSKCNGGGRIGGGFMVALATAALLFLKN